MSTAIPPSPLRTAPPSTNGTVSHPTRMHAPPPPGAQPSGPAGFGNIDPVRLLRRYWPLLAAAAFVGAVVGVAAHFVLLRVSPMYTATAVFQCLQPVKSITSTDRDGVQEADFERFMGTQRANMTSPSVLQAALRSADVARTRWAKQYYVNGNFQPDRALPDLRNSVSASIVNQTALIRLSMTWKDPNDARAIVEAVSNAYMQDLRNSEGRQSAERRQVLDKRRNEINDLIKNLTRQRDEVLASGKVSSLQEGADAAEQQQAKISQDLVDAQQQQAQVASMLTRLRNLAVDNAVIPYPEDMQEDAKRDPIVMDLKSQISQLKVSEQALLQEGFGPEHPSVRSIRKRMLAVQSEYDAQYTVAMQRLYDAQIEELSRSLETIAARQKKLSDELEVVAKRKQDLLKLLLQVEQIERQTAELSEELTLVTRARQELESLASYDVFSRVRLVAGAQTPREVSFPKLAIMLPLGVLLFTGLTASVILLRELMDQRVKGPADVAMIPRLRVLGMVPDAAEDPSRPGSVETAFRDTPGGVVTESFRQIRAPLVSRLDAEGMRTVLVLAGMPGSGATTVASNLALACAGADERVLLIDANFRRPALHRVLGVSESIGLADCLAGQAGLAETVRSTSVPNLSLLTAGSAGNRMLPERLSSEALGRVLAEAAAAYDRVFIDCPPAIVSGDGMAIANRCDAVVMVVRALGEKRGLVSRIRSQLSGTRAELVGVVVNAVKSSAGGYFKRNIQATHEYHNTGKS